MITYRPSAWTRPITFCPRGAWKEALESYQAASNLFEEIGEVEWVALAKRRRADLVSNLFPTSTFLKALEGVAALERRLGDHIGLSNVLVQQALALLASGDYHLAATKLREALSESEAVGEVPQPQYLVVRGLLALAQGELESVRNAIGTLRTGPNPSEWGALDMEAESFWELDRFQELREVLEKQNKLAATMGAGLGVTFIQSRLCELSCEEGRPREGLECFAQHPLPVGMGTRQPPDYGPTACRYLAGDLEAAERSAVQAQEAAQWRGIYSVRIIARAYLMRIRAARGETAKAIAGLRADLTEAEGKGAKSVAFEVALALGDVELREGRPEGRAHLLKLEQEARSREFFRIARLAREALDQHPASPAARPPH
jgi:tetratricopeptide (TPR) repeat protein